MSPNVLVLIFDMVLIITDVITATGLKTKSISENQGQDLSGRIDEDSPNHFRTRRSSSFLPLRNEKVLSKQISQILNQLLSPTSGYDRQIRPQISGPPLEVEVNIAIRSMGPVDEVRQTFALDCYFRQYWTDVRLKYNSTRGHITLLLVILGIRKGQKSLENWFEELAMNWQFISKIWRPDTFIFNGKDSYLHKMTVPNRFIRIAPNGKISYSQRLTIKASCQMNLRKFPLDSQTCPLIIGSFGHDASDIIYKWSKSPLSMDQMELAQYHMVNWNYSSIIQKDVRVGRDNTNVSIISLEFTFQRRTGFFMLQIYIPLTLIVCCSWVTFWLVKTEKGTEIPARTGLGATTVLSIVTIGFSGKGKPQVNYATALDVFIILCFAIVFAALVEFAMLNFLDTLIRRLKRKEAEAEKLISKTDNSMKGGIEVKVSGTSEADDDEAFLGEDMMADEDEEKEDQQTKQAYKATENFEHDKSKWETIETTVLNGHEVEQDAGVILDDRFLSSKNAKRKQHGGYMRRKLSRKLSGSKNCDDQGSCSEQFWIGLESILTRLKCFSMISKLNVHTVCDQVDEVSRKFFPIVFLLINCVYWCLYMYIL